jgi:predicted RNA-binding Zn ribbon-like protein
MVGGDIALDFVNTASAWTTGDPVDRLGGLDGLAEWASAAGLVGPADAAALRDAATVEDAAGLFGRATALRSLLWRLFDAAAHGRRASPADLAALREWTCCARGEREIVQTSAGFEERWKSGVRKAETLLFEIALSAERLLTQGRLDRLHACGGADCEWMFLDLSKNGSRRWRSMATCGNSAKVKKFRTRKTAPVSKDP